MTISKLSLPLVIIFLFISFQKIYSQEYYKIRCDTSDNIWNAENERLVKLANSKNIPIVYTKNRKETIAYEKYYENERLFVNQITLLKKSYDELTSVIRRNNSTINEINESIITYNGFLYIYEASRKNYGTLDILVADIYSSFGGYSKEYLNKYWRTHRTFNEAMEDNEIAFFIIRGICSNLTLILCSFLFVIILRKYFKKKRT